MGRPPKPPIPDDATCLSLCLPVIIQCIACKRERRQDDCSCKKPWDDGWLKTRKESDYFEAWDHLQTNKYRVPQACSNARRSRLKRNSSPKECVKKRRTRVSGILCKTLPIIINI